jgi:acyl-CoA reductase-like NAD-dependent aldehyde dehydrogenase
MATTEAKPAALSTLESFNPATGELVGTVPTITPDQVQGVVDDVARIQPAWAELPLKVRATYMRRAADALLDDIDEVAELLVREQGKPRAEAYTMELLPTVDALHWCAKAGPKILADEKVRMTQAFTLSKSGHFSYEPIGVVGVIAPWNYPWSIPFGEVAIALMAGNGVVLKPASLTPLLGERIRDVFEKGGLPEGLVRVVHGGGAVGDALAKSSAGKIFFTGSVEVGRKVGQVCAERLKGSVLELGGKDPMIVCADADLPNAISGAVWGGFANAGQTCSGIERVYVVREVADRFVEGVAREAEKLRLGDPLEWETEIGPMTSDGQYEIVVELIEDAVATGATKLCGGPADRRRRLRAGGDRPRQRLRVRPRRLGLDQGPPEGRADRPPARVRHGLDQRPLLQPRRLPVRLGRRQGLRRRPLALQIRLLRVRQHQDERLGAGADPRLLVAPLRPHPRRSGPGLGPDPLRQRRDPHPRPARGHGPTAEDRPAHAEEAALTDPRISRR